MQAGLEVLIAKEFVSKPIATISNGGKSERPEKILMNDKQPPPSFLHSVSHSHLGSHRRLSKGAVGGEAGVGASAGGFAQPPVIIICPFPPPGLCGHRQQGLALPPSVNDS